MKGRQFFYHVFVLAVLIIALFVNGCGGGGGGGDSGGGGGGGGGGGSNPPVSPSPGTPSITSVSAPLVPGYSCTINGSNFGTVKSSKDDGNSYVSIYPYSGGTAISPTNYTVWNSTQIVCTVPQLEAGKYYIFSVTVIVAGNTLSSPSTSSAQNTVPVYDSSKKPVIKSISPTTQSVGGAVSITGSSFGLSQGAGSSAGYVQIGNTYASYGLIWSDTSITCTVPTGLADGSTLLYVYTALGGYSDPLSITISSRKPTITKISPTTLLQGGTITITGTNFGATQDPSYVQIGKNQIKTGLIWSEKQISCVVPTTIDEGSYDVLVHTALGGDSNSVPITLTAKTPAISKVNPTTVAQLGIITVTGAYFGASAGTLKIGNAAVTSGVTWSDTSIICTVPKTTPAGSQPVVVTNDLGDSNPSIITVTSIFPLITGVTPAGTHAIGSAVTIGGLRFGANQGTSYLTFATVQQPVASTWNDTSIICVVPNGVVSGNINLIVTVPGIGDSNAFLITIP